MKRSLQITLTVALLLSAVSAFGAEKWTRVQSKNFTLVGNASENQIREVAEGLEVFRTAFSRFFKIKEGSSVATTALVFRSDAAFKPYKPVYQGKPANLDGFFVPGLDLNLIALAADMKTPRVIYHELVHRLMSDNLEAQPLWFQEGWAECFSALEIVGKDKTVRLGRVISEHVALLNQRRFMPLEQLFAVRHGSPEYNEEEKQGVFYAQSWALVHYMMFETEQRRTQFNQFLSQVAIGKTPATAFQEVFRMDLPTFQKVLEAYIQQRQAWNMFELKTPEGLDRSKDMTASVISEAESEFYLGDLLRRIDRLPEAESHLVKALRLDPKLGSAHASMGRLQLDKDNVEEALESLKRAVELDPADYLAHFNYAYVIRRRKEALSDSDRDTLRRELQKAVELNPQFVEATEMLAAENLARDIDIPQTIELLTKAVRDSPGRDTLALQLAFAVSRTEQREMARPFLQSFLAKPGLDAALRRNAENLLEFLDRAKAVDAANREIAALNRARAGEPLPRATEETAAANLAPPDVRRTPSATPPPAPASDVPEPVRRTLSPPPGTSTVLGTLTLLDCANGLTLSLVVDGKLLKFHTATPGEVKFTTFNPAVGNTIKCGPTPGNGVPAAINYRPLESNGSAGVPLAVDFVGVDDTPPSRISALPSIPGTSTVKGLLTRLDCLVGISITLTSEGKTLRFYSEKKDTVAFLNGPNSDGTVTCGPMPGAGLPVTVLYRPSNNSGVTGEPVIVQFQGN